MRSRTPRRKRTQKRRQRTQKRTSSRRTRRRSRVHRGGTEKNEEMTFSEKREMCELYRKFHESQKHETKLEFIRSSIEKNRKILSDFQGEISREHESHSKYINTGVCSCYNEHDEYCLQCTGVTEETERHENNIQRLEENVRIITETNEILEKRFTHLRRVSKESAQNIHNVLMKKYPNVFKSGNCEEFEEKYELEEALKAIQ
jgi:hypothetical protein